MTESQPNDLAGAWAELVAEVERVAPRTRSAIRPAASDAARKAQQELGVEFNDELHAWFGLHGGAEPFFDGSLLPFSSIVSADDAVHHTVMIREVWADSPHATGEHFYEEDDDAGDDYANAFDEFQDDDADFDDDDDDGSASPLVDDEGSEIHIVVFEAGNPRGADVEHGDEFVTEAWLTYEVSKSDDDIDQPSDESEDGDWCERGLRLSLGDGVDDDAGPPKLAGTIAGTWLPEYVTIGIDGSGGGLFVDLRPGEFHRSVRFWDKVDADYAPIAARSIAELLRGVTTSLRTGAPVAGWVARVENGTVDWDVAPDQSAEPVEEVP